MPLRPYQLRDLDQVRYRFRTDRAVLLTQPCGSGKGFLAAYICHSAAAKGKRIIFLVNRRTLVQDMSRRLDALGLDHGVIMGNHPRRKPWLNVHVASIDTLRNRQTPPPADMLIIDETRFALSQSWRETIAKYPNAKILGLDATPIRVDGQGLGVEFGGIYDSMVVGPSVQELIDLGHLVKSRVLSPGQPDVSKVKTTGGDFNQAGLSSMCDTNRLVGDIVKHWTTHAPERKTVAFAVDQKHAHHITENFQKAGIQWAYVGDDTSHEERERLWKDLEHGNLMGVSSVGVIGYGWDCLDSETKILTATGWRGMGEVSIGDSVYSMNLDSGKMELVNADAVGERPLREGERMVSLKNQRVNIRTTEGHKFFVKQFKQTRAFSDTFFEWTAMELSGKRSPYIIPTAADMDGFTGLPLTDDQIKFIAWFMTDGGFDGSSMSISQVKHHKDGIRELLTRIGFNFSEKIRHRMTGTYAYSGPMHVFRVRKAELAPYLPYLSKNVSPLLHAMTKEQFWLFWQELLKGDGERSHPSKSGWLWCDRQEQVDAYTEMAVTRGFSASYSTRITKTGKLVFRISVRDDRWIRMNPPCCGSSAQFAIEDGLAETVWCVTNKNKTLVTRRGGKIAIIGNCPIVSSVICARPTRSLALHLQQIGRGSRPHPGKQDMLILDHAGNTNRLDALYEDDREWSLAGCKRKPGEKTEPIYTCPKCKQVSRPGSDRCRYCGAPVLKQYRSMVTVQQDLKEFQRERKMLAKEEWKAKLDTVGLRRQYEKFKEIGVQRGYKPAWARMRFKTIFQCDPPPAEVLIEGPLLADL